MRRVVQEFSEGEIDESDEEEAEFGAADDLDDGLDFSGTWCALMDEDVYPQEAA